MAKEFKLKNGDSELIVSPDGGALVAFNYFGFNYLAEKFNGNFIESGQGQILLPWPNRIKGGVYEYLGTQYQLPINEVAHNNAIHGLLRWDKFYEESITEDSLKLKSFLVAQQGYPFELEVSLSYNLTSSGFKVTTEVINKSLMAVPFGLGWHPYFVVSNEFVNDWHLQIDANMYYEVDIDLLPTNLESSDGSDYDFRKSKKIGNTVLDTCIAGFDGRGINATLCNEASNRTLEVYSDGAFKYLMVFSGDSLKDGLKRRSIALEPMTCPANAFNSKNDLVDIAPNQKFEGYQLLP